MKILTKVARARARGENESEKKKVQWVRILNLVLLKQACLIHFFSQSVRNGVAQ